MGSVNLQINDLNLKNLKSYSVINFNYDVIDFILCVFM